MNKSIYLFFALLFLPVTVFARQLDCIALYGDAKYNGNWQSFEYVRPDAPKGGRVVLPAYGTFDNFNPFIFKGIAASQVADLTLDSLAFVPADDVTVAYPLLAKSFELTKEYVGFFLDERAKFSDGTPVLADDVIFSFNSLIEKGSPFYKVYYSDVEKVEKINDRHIRFWFKPDSNNKELPLIISQIKIFSAHDWQGRDFAKPELRAPLGSGPYVLDGFSPNKYLIFRRNPDYWGKDIPSRRGFYNFDEIRYDYYQDTTVTLQALFAGNIDMREEYIAKIWVTGYNNELVKSGQIIKENISHNNTARLQNFGFNLRREKFADPRVREAIDWAFNYEWAGENLFYNQYSRLFSYFTNSGMEATDLPQGSELKILNKYKDELPETVFTKAPSNPVYADVESSRSNLRHAVKLLNEAGYDFVDGKMTNLKTGEPLEIEVLSNSANGSSFTRVMLPFVSNLAKIGIKAEFRNVEVNVFKNRLDNFDFDMAILTFPISQLPGNEQKEFWGSLSADIKGSYNLLGIKNPVVDKIVDGLVTAQNKEDYIAHIKALDRVLLNGHYMVMQWYSPYERIAYRNRFEHKKTDLKVGFQPDTWWIKEDK
mgnify:FL=1